MNISDFLEKNKNEIIESSVARLNSARLKSYTNASPETNRYRLKKLYELCISSVESKNLLPIIEHSEKIARERFESGFDLHEVHTAYNVIEECIWKRIIESVEAEKLGEYLGLISTILGAGKETLALTYVSLAGTKKVTTLDLSGIFQR